MLIESQIGSVYCIWARINQKGAAPVETGIENIFSAKPISHKIYPFQSQVPVHCSAELWSMKPIIWMIKTHLICRLLRCIHSCESFHFLPHLLTRLSSAPHPSTLPSPLDTFWKEFFGANISCLPFNQTASVITNLTRMFGDVVTFREMNIYGLSCLLGMVSKTYFWKLSLKGVPSPHLVCKINISTEKVYGLGGVPPIREVPSVWGQKLTLRI